MSFDALRIGATGMLAAQKQMEVASNNVANAGNDKHSRQRVNVAAIQAANQVGGGVRVLGVDRIRDVFADITWRTETATAEAESSRANVLARAEAALGPINAGLTSLVDQFYTAWNQLSMSPADMSAREGVIAAAGGVAADFRRIYDDIGAQINDTKTTVDSITQEANLLLKRVASLNTTILEAEVSSVSANALLDERDATVDQLSKLIGATMRSGSNGVVEVVVDGYAIVTGEYAGQFEVDGTATALDPMRLTVVGGASLNVTGGKIGGMFRAVNTDLPDLVSQLDSAADALRTQVNTQHMLGYDLDGNPGVALFAGTSAGDLELSTGFTARNLAAGLTPATGDGNNALAISRQRQDMSPTSATALIRQYTVNLGAVVDTARRTSEIAETVVAGTDAARKEAMSVNVDEEMIDLIRFQRAYQAAAQAISVANEALDSLINRMLR